MPEPSTEIKSGSDFCQLLKKDIGSWCKDIRIQDDVLLHFKSPVNIEVDIADEKSISLASVLERYSLAPKFKLLIAYILAKSVWQLYESDFMNVQWTTEAIHLFSEREDEDGDPDERGIDWAPYFALLYDNAPDDLAKERLPRGEIFHRYPRVLALGTLLYELGRNRSKRQRPSPTRVVPSSPTEAPSLERLVNNEARRIAIGVDRNHWPSFDLKDTETLEKYRLIVLECVSNSLFIPTPEKTSPKSPQELEDMLTIEERRSILFQKVVLPLKKLVQSTGWVDEDGKIQRRLVGGVAARLNEANTHHIKPAKLLTNNSDADGSKIPLDDLGMNATEWLGKIMTNPVTETVVSEYRRQRTLSGERIRIAVLDTGYDPESIFFSSKVRKQRIKGWNDYVKKIVADTDEVEEFDSVKTTATPEDNDGHGTHVLSVLMKVAPAADIYVARIARKTKDLQNASQNIADAIKWAWKDCKANIITMSFGFDDEIHVNCKSVISKAILKAELKADPGVLFFAAAANDGGNRKEMFPARDMHVLSIRGTDEFGWPRPFNPPEGYNPSKCFMTLGLDVPGASLSTSDHEGAEICKSGTSVATPIAAGIAATMLGYARIYEDEVKEYLNEHQVRKLGNIWGRSGMTALFAQMATEMTNKWSYLHLNEFADMTKRLILATIATAVKNS
ncbi:peptidase S8/S53, subtilisin/kexin/sedolisin [Mariannaea sp. PMI_226]|nr:peptidase S8/S53, subtilisin/kexin/sedolisin [Mariannaea sp. PMI_226]